MSDFELILEGAQVQQLTTLVEEATRSTAEGVRYFVEPTSGALQRVMSKRHHMIFGRRGSGKSSLLRKAAADLTVDRRPIAWIDMEPFKGHSYPDLLISVLIKAFDEFRKWLETAAVAPSSKKSFWERLFGTRPSRGVFNKTQAMKLVEDLQAQISALERELHAAEAADITQTEATEGAASLETSAGIALKAPVAGEVKAEAKQLASGKDSTETVSKFKTEKVDFLRRHIMDYQRLFVRMADMSGGPSFLFLDDLYHIRRTDQPRVVDYFHSIAKNNQLWLKIGTIRHRSQWYLHGDPPTGLKLGDDADEIDLDLTLEKYTITKSFLTAILGNFLKRVDLRMHDLITEAAIDRLVLASGGVARDFLSIFRRAVNVGRERAGGPRGPRIGVEDINVAAGEYDSSKREELKRDVYKDEENSLVHVFDEVRDFCIENTETNCFLINKDGSGAWIDAIHELVDLKLLHLIRSRVTLKQGAAQIYEAYMLDLSQYAGTQKRKGLEMIEFWRPEAKELLRRESLVHPRAA
jgi:hypothetical protein